MRNILTACLLSLAALSAYSADGTSVKEGGAAQMFVTKATEEGLTQVELGKLAANVPAQ
jgi:predicted outer membrane protein